MRKVTVIGCGAWGMALASHLARLGHDVIVWCHSAEIAEQMRNERALPKVFPGITFPDYIRYTDDRKRAASERDLLVFAVASPFTRSTAKQFAPFIPEDQRIVTVTKGIEDETLMTQTQILRDVLPGRRIGALSGPTHAEEVAMDMPTTIVSASTSPEAAGFVQDIFMNTCMRVYTNSDVKGVELCGAMKNIIALASGMIDGLGYGDNTRAALITRGMAEITRLGLAMGCNPGTFYGLAGIGDLIVTATSRHSRNFNAGHLMGMGKTPEEAVREVGMVVEGINALPAAMELEEQYHAELPICNGVNRIVKEHADPLDIVRELMERPKKAEAHL